MVSLYFHIPFCQKKCPYCHFYVIPNEAPFKTTLLKGLQLEWEKNLDKIASKNISTIYFGGGTPSLFGAEAISSLLKRIATTHPIDGIEITLEANPELATKKLLEDYFAAGINRLSFGVQSFDNELLTILGREHSAEHAIETIHLAKEVGFSNITIDLMYDIPHQTLSMWECSLMEAVKLPITHLSLYNLTIEPHTQFFKQQKALKPHIPSHEESFEMYTLARKVMQDSGFFQYEISAFAKPGFVSKHNSGYWKGRPFLGFGPSAFSYFEGKRFRNVAHLNRYLKALEENESPVDFEEELEESAKIRELLAIHLRLLEGVQLKHFGTLPEETTRVIEKLIGEGLLVQLEDRLLLTERGIMLYDTVAAEVV